VWFKIWSNIIKECRELSRLQLSELSNCSLWTIKSLQKDFLEWDAFIVYEKGKFRFIQIELERTLSTLFDYLRPYFKPHYWRITTSGQLFSPSLISHDLWINNNNASQLLPT